MTPARYWSKYEQMLIIYTKDEEDHVYCTAYGSADINMQRARCNARHPGCDGRAVAADNFAPPWAT